MSFDPAARRRSRGGGVKSQSPFYEEDRRRQAGTAPYPLKEGSDGGRRPSQDTDEGRRRRSRSNSPHGYDRRHHFDGRHEQSPGRNHSRSRSYDQHASSTRDPRAYPYRSHDEQSSGSSRSRSYDRHANRYVNPNQSHDERSSRQDRRRSRSRSRDRHSSGRSSSSGGSNSWLDHQNSQGGQRCQPQVSPHGPSALNNAQGHGRRSKSCASADATSASAASSRQITTSATLARSASAPTRRDFCNPLEPLRRIGIRSDLIESLGVGDDCRLLRLMMSVSLFVCLFVDCQLRSEQWHLYNIAHSSERTNIHVRIALLLPPIDQ